MYKSFLVKYGEIGVKGKNRYIFEKYVNGADPPCVKDSRGRV